MPVLSVILRRVFGKLGELVLRKQGWGLVLWAQRLLEPLTSCVEIKSSPTFTVFQVADASRGFMEGKLIAWSQECFTGRRGQRQLCEGQILLQAALPFTSSLCGCRDRTVGNSYSLAWYLLPRTWSLGDQACWSFCS